MVGWNDLSEDSKKEVVKRLDLMSRCSMRSTCHLDRQIVNSTDLYLPRVRIASKVNDCFLMIYTGIDKYLRMEFVKNGPGTVVYRMENTCDRTHAITKRIPSITSYELAFKVIKSLLIRDTVLIGILEFEFFMQEMQRQTFFITTMLRSLGPNAKFRAKKLMTNYKSMTVTDLHLYKNLMDLNVLEEFRNEAIQTRVDSIYIQKIIDLTLFPEPDPDYFQVLPDVVPLEKFMNVPVYDSFYFLGEYRFETPEILLERCIDSPGFSTARYGPECSDNELWDHQHFPVEQLNESVEMKRYESNGGLFIFRWNRSKCGLWVHMVSADEEHKFLDFFKNEKCGLSWLCKNCTNPFDYWYYRNLPRRVQIEQPPYDFVLVEQDEKKDEKLKIFERKLKKKFEEEDGKAENLNKKKKALTENEKSWGFKIKKMNSKPIRQKPPVIFKHLEDYENANQLVADGFLLQSDQNKFIITSKWTHKSDTNALIELMYKKVGKKPPKNFNKQSPPKKTSDDGIMSKVIEAGKAIASWTPFGVSQNSSSNESIESPSYLLQRGHKLSAEEYVKLVAQGRKFNGTCGMNYDGEPVIIVDRDEKI